VGLPAEARAFEYVLVFATTTSQIRSALPVFAASLDTVRFT